MNRPDSTAENVSKIAELKLSSCGLEFAVFRKIAIAELRLRSNISLKVAELRLRMCFLQVAELRLRTQKKVARARLCNDITGMSFIRSCSFTAIVSYVESDWK
jgi:hypothetical protein